MQQFVALFRSPRLIWLMLGIGLLVRAGYGLRQPALEWDAYLYRDIAHNLIEGRGYTLDGKTPDTSRAPVPTFIIAGVYALGGNDLVVRLAWVLIGLLVVWVAYRLALENHGLVAANLASLGVALYPYNIVLGGSTGTEMPNILLLLTAILFLRRWLRSAAVFSASITGLALGLAVLTRPASLSFVPLVAILICLRPRAASVKMRIGGAVVFLCSAVLMFAPWSVRTSRITGVFNVTTSVGPENLWLGFDPWFIAWSRGEISVAEYGAHCTAAIPGTAKTQKERDQAYMACVRKFCMEQPGAALWLLGYKSAKFWTIPGFTGVTVDPPLRQRKLLVRAVGLLSYVPMALICLWGIVRFTRAGRVDQIWVYLFWAAVTFATNVWFSGILRYRFSHGIDELMIVIGAAHLAGLSVWGRADADHT